MLLDGVLLSLVIFGVAAIAGSVQQQKSTFIVTAARKQMLLTPMIDIPRNSFHQYHSTIPKIGIGVKKEEGNRYGRKLYLSRLLRNTMDIY